MIPILFGLRVSFKLQVRLYLLCCGLCQNVSEKTHR